LGATTSPPPTDSAATRTELAALIEDVAGADGRVYGAHDDRGHTLDTIKIIAIEETGEFAGVYHSWRDDPGVFDIHLATSSDLLAWTWQVMLTSEASQPTIRAAQDGGYVTAWEITRLAGDPSPTAFACYRRGRPAPRRKRPTSPRRSDRSRGRCLSSTPPPARAGPGSSTTTRWMAIEVADHVSSAGRSIGASRSGWVSK
jgi:hypothetical protein